MDYINDLNDKILLFAKDHLREYKGSLIYPPSLFYVFINYINKQNENIDMNYVIGIFKNKVFKKEPEYIEYYEKKCFVDWTYFNIKCPKEITIRSDVKLKKYFGNNIAVDKGSFLRRDELILTVQDWYFCKTGKKINQQLIIDEFNKFFGITPQLIKNSIGYKGLVLKNNE
jgi:hypothetical protein